MYDELVMRLREDKSWVEQGLSETEHKISEHIQQAADIIEGLTALLRRLTGELVIKPRWIPVTERLPEQDVSVIGAVYHTDLIIAEDGELIEEAYARCQAEAAKHPRGELCFYGEDGWYGCDGFPMICAPSCWMPLPDPPKEKNNG